MKTAVKVALGGGALAALLWLLSRGKATDASVGVTVVKTSSECDPSSPNYAGDAACSASSNPLTDVGNALGGVVDTIGSTLSTAVTGIFGSGMSSGADPNFTPSLPPKTTEISPARAVPGSDGPATPILQRTVGLGARLDERVITTSSSKVAHK